MAWDLSRLKCRSSNAKITFIFTCTHYLTLDVEGLNPYFYLVLCNWLLFCSVLQLRAMVQFQITSFHTAIGNTEHGTNTLSLLM